MNAHPQAIATMRAITISDEYGSGGGEIVARLAQRLGWQLVDHAVVEQAARELEVQETEVEKHDEEYIESDRSGILDRIDDEAFERQIQANMSDRNKMREITRQIGPLAIADGQQAMKNGPRRVILSAAKNL